MYKNAYAKSVEYHLHFLQIEQTVVRKKKDLKEDKN